MELVCRIQNKTGGLMSGETKGVWKWIAVAALGVVGGLIMGQYGLKPDIAALQEGQNRIEHYLSSKDPNYWQTAKAMDP